jgi:hypothetical protein
LVRLLAIEVVVEQRYRVRMKALRVKKLHRRALSPMRFRFERRTTMNSLSPWPEVAEVLLVFLT